MNKKANRLINETSPYLLQHAYNPVDWFPWGNEAFEKAKKEDKPILVSIGYSTCHWCHVMERESFEDLEVAQYMNKHFINIKIDREERPDIDQIYMDAVQALTGSGGWPLNCFLTPDLKPFYGGTYFPPKPNYGRTSWKDLLVGIQNAYHHKKTEVAEQTNKLLDFIKNSDNHFIKPIEIENEEGNVFNEQLAHHIFEKLKENFDTEYGGFGMAPKFPSSMSLKLLLDYSHLFKNEEALTQVNLSLEKMIKGGLYDQLGGGFARYSTDKEWLAPHFEKMLYDNALLVSLLSDAFTATKNELYQETIHEVLDWVNREMTSEEGGFYSALDADTDGVEGKFYVWDKKEIFSLLGDDAYIFNAFYDITEQGNWEGKNIPRRRISIERLAMSIGWEELELKRIMEKWKLRLFLEREKRSQPALDDKILLDWNALMCTAYCKAYKSTGKEKYKRIAEQNISFVYGKMKNEDGFYHSYKDGEAKHDAFLNDYAFLIEALIELYQITYANCYLHEAKRLTDYLFKHFYEDGCFYFTKKGQLDILARKKNLYDNALPSGNSTMVQNLQKLSIIFGDSAYRECAINLLSSLIITLEKHPQSFSKWANAALYEIVGIKETAIVGKHAYSLAKSLNKEFVPNKIVMSSLKNDGTFPLLKDREVESETYIYLCSNFSCQYPVNTIPEYLELLSQ